MRIRPATVDDAESIATAHVHSWQGAYRGVFPDEFLDGMEIAPRAERWRPLLADVMSRELVAESDDGMLGFASVCASRDDDAGPGVGELAAIYAEPSAWGTGAGRALMSAALDTLTAEGYREATLWVLSGNARAIRFYEAAGWHDDGTSKDDTMAGTVVTEKRFRRRLP